MNKTVWIVVANRVFQARQPTGPVEEMEAFIHPEARLHDQDLLADRPGRTFDRVGGGSHVDVPDTGLAEQETNNFAWNCRASC